MTIKKWDGPKLIKTKQAGTLVSLVFDRNRLMGLTILFLYMKNMKIFIKVYYKLTLPTKKSQVKNAKHLFQKKRNSSYSKQAQECCQRVNLPMLLLTVP